MRRLLAPTLVLSASLFSAGIARAQAPASPVSPDRSHAPAPGPPPALRLPAIQKLRLSNGIPVFLVERHKVPLVQALVVFRGGAAADPQNRPGLTNLTASLLERGAGSRSALEISDIADYLGANLSAGAGWDSTTVGVNVPSARLEPGLALLGDVVMNPTFPAPEVERVRSELLTEILQWRDDPEQVASVAFSKAVYGAHPYSRDLQGDASSVQSITRDEIVRFHAERYAPATAAIVIAGDAAAGSLLPLLEGTFGKWKAAGGLAAAAIPPARQVGKRRVVLVDKPDAPQSQIVIGRVGPARSTPDFFPLIVTNTILGGSFTSRLNHNLRETKGYTYGAESQFDFRLSTGPFIAEAAVQTDKTGAALTEFFKELEGIRSRVPADELARAKNYTARRFPSAFETAGQLAGRIRDQFVYGLPEDYFNTYVARIEAVTAADVQRVARTWIDPAGMVIVIVGDRKKIEAEVQSIDDVLGRPRPGGS